MSEPADPQPMRCDHCGLAVPATAVDPAAEHQFCCGGCRTVFRLLQDQGLDDFYRLRADMGSEGGGVRPDPRDDRYAVFDSDWFRSSHVREHEGVAETVLLAEGIHCAACVWLLEQLPRVQRGVATARVGVADGTITVRWRDDETTPAQVARAIAGLGYPVHPFSERQRRESAERVRRKALARVLVAGASAIGTMHPSLYVLIGVFTGDQDAAVRQTFAWLALLASLPAVTWCALPFYRGLRAAWRLKRMTLDANAALVIAVGWLTSFWQLLQGGEELYVDAVTMFIAFLLMGRFVAQEARHRANGGMDALRSILPMAARTGEGAMVAADDLPPETELLVDTGERLPADGTAVAGAVIDESILTGEARPVRVAAGDPLWAGTVVRLGPLRMLATSAGMRSRMGGLLRQVHSAIDASARGGWHERVQAWFGPAVLVGAVLIGLMWADAGRGWEQAIALVLVACPCALALTQPLVFARLAAVLAGRGALLRNPALIERLADIRHLVVDKTGTLTAGRVAVSAAQWTEAEGDVRADLLARLAAAEERARHPYAVAITEWAREQAADGADGADGANPVVEELPGLGIVARFADGELWVGNAALMARQGAASQAMDDAAIHVAWQGAVVLALYCEDAIRAQAASLVAAAHRRQWQVHLASGDGAAACHHVAQELGIDHVVARQTPEDKADLVRHLQGEGGVMMVGDGINDAPALSAADIGIGVRGGLEAAMSCADCYLGGDMDVSGLLGSAENAARRLWWALVFSIAYNALAVAAVTAGWWGPVVCAVAMPLSSLTVVLIASIGRGQAAESLNRQ